MAVVLTGCAVGADEGAALPPDEAVASTGAPAVEHDATRLWLVTDDVLDGATDDATDDAPDEPGPADEGGRLLVAEVHDADTEVVHAVARPGDHPTVVVLALTRTAPSDDTTSTVSLVAPTSTTDVTAAPAAAAAPAMSVAAAPAVSVELPVVDQLPPAPGLPRYELRYVTVVDGTPSPLFGFPWRLQVDGDLAGVLDVAPLPVWSPDGDAVAWVEWQDDGTRLRTVGWRDDEVGSNPSDEAVAYHLDDVPAGVQLTGWEATTDGRALLTGARDGEVWRIRVDPGAGTVVTPDDPEATPTADTDRPNEEPQP